MVEDRHLTTTFAEGTRRAILALLASRTASGTELGEPVRMSLPAIFKHLKVLEHAGLIARSRDAQCRPCRFAAEPFKNPEWLEEDRRFWEESFERLEDYLREVQKRELKSTDQKKKEKENGRRK